MRHRRIENILLGLAGVFVVGALWHLAVVVTNAETMPSPLEVFAGLRELAAKGLLYRYAFDSLWRVTVGYTLAALAGIPVGLAIGWFPRFASAASPLIQFLRPISPIAWIPLAIVMFGISNAAPIFLIFLAAFFPIATSAANGVRGVPPIYILAGRNFGLGGAALLFRILLPAALPQILTGLRIALGIAWLVMVAAEMIAVNSGLGYLIIDARNAGKRYDLVVAGMLLIGLIGLGLDVLMRRIETLKPVRWGIRTEGH